MFHVAVIVNENEVAHSAFADTVRTLQEPLGLGEQKAKTYRFYQFDKFNIHRLFLTEDENNLHNFDSVVLATNATNNTEVLEAFRNNKSEIEKYLGQGKGLLICSQKKLSVDFEHDSSIEGTGILPERYDYSLFNRPEKSSSQGKITISAAQDRICRYPNLVDDKLIDYRCQNNNFMPHRYRAHVVPQHPSQFEVILADKKSPPLQDALRSTLDSSRGILLRSGNLRERLVVTSMALDWAGHKELLENLLVYITEGTDQLGVVRKAGSEADLALDAYLVRARVAKVPVRVYPNLQSAELAKQKHDTLIVSPAYSSEEVDGIWAELCRNKENGTDLYHMLSEPITGGFQLHRKSVQSRRDDMCSSAAAWLGRTFYPGLWGKSIWSFNYVVSMMAAQDFELEAFAPVIVDFIEEHTPSEATPKVSYDNVINASAQMLEVLHLLLESGALSKNNESKLKAEKMKQGTVSWLTEKLDDKSITLRDRTYVLLALFRMDLSKEVEGLDKTKLHEIAAETYRSYKSNTFSRCETVELAQVLELSLKLKLLGVAADSDVESSVAKILALLAKRQSDEGYWRNISETAEVTLTLLVLSDKYQDFAGRDVQTELILRGVQCIIGAYDSALGNWQNDTNATAKAAHVLGAFDRQIGVSASDFFAGIQTRSAFRAFVGTNVRDLAHDGLLLSELLNKEAQLSKVKKSAGLSAARLRRYRLFTFGATFVTLLSLSTLALVLGILIVSHPTVAEQMVGDWQGYLVSSFVGILLSIVVMGSVSVARGR
ncbi:MAG: hypothetical protein ABJJ92_17620, partial [Tateyamaria sp.]